MAKINAILEELGFSPNEARVYMASLDIGEVTASELARDVELPRTTVLGILEQMHRSGLMNFYLKKKRKYWIAQNPQKLLLTMKERESKLAGILPKLESMRHANSPSPKISIYTGTEEIKLIMDDILKTRQNIQAVVSWDDWLKFFGGDYIFDFIEARAANFLRIEMLTPRTQMSSNLKKRDESQLRRTKFLPEDLKINNSNFIYGSKVALISTNKKEPMGVLIEDDNIAQTMRVFFTTLWNASLSN